MIKKYILFVKYIIFLYKVYESKNLTLFLVQMYVSKYCRYRSEECGYKQSCEVGFIIHYHFYVVQYWHTGITVSFIVSVNVIQKNSDISDLCGLQYLSDISVIRYIKENFYCFVLWGPEILSDISDNPI